MHTPVLDDDSRRQGLSSRYGVARVCRVPEESQVWGERPAPARSTAILSGLMDREILPTLRGLHREQLQVADQDSRKLARLLLDDPARFRAEVTRQALRGAPWPVLAAEMLAPVARDLGVMWEEDLCDFLDVTEAMGRLQSVLRDAIGPQVGRGRARPGHSILLAGAPGETHTYGLCHVAGLLRDAGWTTTTVAGTGPIPWRPSRRRSRRAGTTSSASPWPATPIRPPCGGRCR